MKHWIYIGFIAALGVLWFVSSESDQEIPRASGEFDHAVYVWQRAWDEELKNTVSERAASFENVTVLGAEINWRKEQGWSIKAVGEAINYARENQDNDAGLAVRIGVGVAQHRWDETSVSYALEMIEPVVDGVDRVQIDYDCPTSKLADYARFLEALRRRYPEKKIEFTALPDWLYSDDFSRLLEHVDSYVMQVHGVSGHGAGWVLCDAEQAKKIAEKCAEHYKPYLIALPTYRHVLHLDDEGAIKDVSSEGGRLSVGGRYEVVAANAAELAALIRAWESDRPAMMRGVVWFRLPIPTDRMNWTWDTLSKVKQGIVPEGKLKIGFEHDASGLVKVVIENTSDQRMDWPKELIVEWSKGFCIANGVEGDYAIKTVDRKNSLELKWRFNNKEAIHPGQKINVAWLRFDQPESVIKTITISSKNIVLDEKRPAESQ